MRDADESPSGDAEEGTTRSYYGPFGIGTTRSYYGPFGIAVRRREEHLAALRGKVYAEWQDSLNRASQLFSGNSLELVRRLSTFVGSPVHVSELPEDFDVGANRLLHNYLASLVTLRDVQRMVHPATTSDAARNATGTTCRFMLSMAVSSQKCAGQDSTDSPTARHRG